MNLLIIGVLPSNSVKADNNNNGNNPSQQQQNRNKPNSDDFFLVARYPNTPNNNIRYGSVISLTMIPNPPSHLVPKRIYGERKNQTLLDQQKLFNNFYINVPDHVGKIPMSPSRPPITNPSNFYWSKAIKAPKKFQSYEKKSDRKKNSFEKEQAHAYTTEPFRPMQPKIDDTTGTDGDALIYSGEKNDGYKTVEAIQQTTSTLTLDDLNTGEYIPSERFRSQQPEVVIDIPESYTPIVVTTNYKVHEH